MAAAQGAAARGQRYDLIFLDPPYQQGLLERTLPLCAALLAPGGLVYAETGLALEFADGEQPEWLAPWDIVRADKAGMVFYHLLKYKA
jgi:16S rRNA G966 N2-methylase RsmD